ncbi:CaiB/BaiF CoA-transferase family protein [Bosea sp. (in: a-proteobacteria)]|uniref:CaiB/BaiF CoA transferase family protein n=1 Tax=Bosea sp. (in: a-proteobacteria) TaxID=1871050 RepID=UPI002611EDC6|nr:CoA transferase [Bosea sp. (in: a-proteobacteria)]MCO5089511.1 CoA transferase [Bosea sp. (in: a-proteobacteria)]
MRALDGVKVLELSHYIAGPFACQLLADLGADVVKVEPPAGEAGRRAPPFTEDGESLYFATFNHNKRTLSLDLRGPEAERVLPALIRWADVIITNFANDVPDRLNFGWDKVEALNPRAILIHITGFGSWSPIGAFPAFDPVIQAMSGFADMVGDPAGPPFVSNILFGDIITAHQSAAAAMAALHLRERTGKGSFIEVSMLRSLAPLLGDYVAQSTTLGQRPTRVGNRQTRRFINAFQTADGHLVVAPITPDQWKSFCDVIGRPEWGAPEVTSNRINVTDEALRRDLENSTSAWMKRRTSDEAAATLRAAGVPCGPMWSISELPRANETFDLRMLGQAQLINGTEVTIPGSPFELRSAAAAPRPDNKVPAVGNHSAAILKEIGVA